jgi:hypothetical protein
LYVLTGTLPLKYIVQMRKKQHCVYGGFLLVVTAFQYDAESVKCD